jgi:hypothetical protein
MSLEVKRISGIPVQLLDVSVFDGTVFSRVALLSASESAGAELVSDLPHRDVPQSCIILDLDTTEYCEYDRDICCRRNWLGDSVIYPLLSQTPGVDSDITPD